MILNRMDDVEPAWAKRLREQLFEMHSKQCETFCSLQKEVEAYGAVLEDHGETILNLLQEQRNLKVMCHRQNEQLARVDKRVDRMYKKGTLAVVETLTQCRERMDNDLKDVFHQQKEVYGQTYC